MSVFKISRSEYLALLNLASQAISVRAITSLIGTALTVGCSLLLLPSVEAQTVEATVEESFSEADLKFFENEVRPLLIAQCLECHAERKQEGSLRLDSRDAILTGGDSGPAVNLSPDSPSLLIEAVEYHELEMPPAGKLPEAQIEVLRRWVELGLPWPQSTPIVVSTGPRQPSAADREHWAYRPLVAPPLPMIADTTWAQDDLDLFVLEAQRERGLTPAPEADRSVLARRAAFDLTGMPPAPALLESFLRDQEPDAYERYVDQLLQSPQFGERWADVWFDWVRFAESDGYKADDFRPTAWRYRDYVIQAFNEDLPFNQFLVEQIAGDVIASPTARSRVATGYLRLWIYEYNQRDVRTQWQTILDDVTETTADAFLGMGLGCAKCHDHKYDPLVQEDFFRLQATFASISAVDQTPVLDAASQAVYEEQLANWKSRYQPLIDEKRAIEKPFFDRAMQAAIDKFPPDIRGMFSLAEAERTSLEQQLVELSMRQIDLEVTKIEYEKKLEGEVLARWQSLKEQLAQAEKELPAKPEMALGVAELSRAERAWPVLGDSERLVAPGLPLVLVAEGSSPEFGDGEPRRLQFANWLVSEANPLTPRVMANRVWERLFGRGLVASSSDFGRLTPAPEMPELLDFIAARWRQDQWSFKRLVRSIVTSATYRQSSTRSDELACRELDPQNQLWWKTERRRLEAGQIRDSLLVASGELQERTSGPSANHDALCRSIYLKVLRNTQDSVLGVFDFPDRIRSVSCRNLTTTPQQALLLMNHPWVRARGDSLAKQTSPGEGRWNETTAIQLVFKRTLSREPRSEEREVLSQFVRQCTERGQQEGLSPQAAQEAAWFDVCHGLLNSNEFLFLE